MSHELKLVGITLDDHLWPTNYSAGLGHQGSVKDARSENCDCHKLVLLSELTTHVPLHVPVLALDDKMHQMREKLQTTSGSTYLQHRLVTHKCICQSVA